MSNKKTSNESTSATSLENITSLNINGQVQSQNLSLFSVGSTTETGKIYFTKTTLSLAQNVSAYINLPNQTLSGLIEFYLYDTTTNSQQYYSVNGSHIKNVSIKTGTAINNFTTGAITVSTGTNNSVQVFIVKNNLSTTLNCVVLIYQFA